MRFRQESCNFCIDRGVGDQRHLWVENRKNAQGFSLLVAKRLYRISLYIIQCTCVPTTRSVVCTKLCELSLGITRSQMRHTGEFRSDFPFSLHFYCSTRFYWLTRLNLICPVLNKPTTPPTSFFPWVLTLNFRVVPLLLCFRLFHVTKSSKQSFIPSTFFFVDLF